MFIVLVLFLNFFEFSSLQKNLVFSHKTDLTISFNTTVALQAGYIFGFDSV